MKFHRVSPALFRPSGTLSALALTSAIALASFSPLANAQSASSVRMYGLVDMSIGRFQAPGARPIYGTESGKMTTSYFGFAGTEDLGGGVSAIFALESFFLADTGGIGRFVGDVFFSRASYVGLNSGFGRVTVGRQATALFNSTLLFNSFGSSFGFSPSIRHYFTSGTVTGDSVWNDAVQYATPKFAGFTASVMVAPGESNGGNNVGGNVIYGAGPFAATAVYQKVAKGATVDDSTTWQLGASYAFEKVKLFGQHGRVQNETTTRDYNLTEAGLSVTFASSRAMLSYGTINPDVGPTRDTISLGYSYLLSKRTDVYAVVMSDKIEGLSAGNNYAVGMRHSF
ncbi:porin [Variovorax dokdonensis]|uniref:Porin n=1 Tax=Variovorax dokdonensis TaxID=344883 RepID=A0ABT7NE00_9BURK|nr:porin [Variovorax dokdonensis]MDM0046174.1 porin [Variovorax dokdonensis]